MDFTILNIIESSITLAIFYMVYRLVLSMETHFKLNRIFLISSLLFAVIIPFLNFSVGNFSGLFSNTGVNSQLVNIRRGYNELNEVVIYAYSNKISWSFIKGYIPLIYWTGVIAAILFFLLGIVKAILLILKSKRTKYGKYIIIETSEIVVPFSLFKWIIINPEKYTSKDVKQIIAHEQMHAFQLHSVDLVFVEVLVILFWFNPFIYWYRKSIREIHEFLADEAVVENGFDCADYSELLFSQVAGGRFLGLTSRFSYSLSKNRLKMLTMIKSKNISKLKIAIIAPFILGAVFFFACNEDSTDSSNSLGEVVVVSKANENPEEISTDQVDGAISENTKSAEVLEEVYFNAEVMPKFNGGEADEFRLFIAKNLKYPKEALKSNIEGKVYVQFDIDKEGNLTNAIVVRGVHSALDEEALRVTNISPKWEPAMHEGKTVRTRFTFPIVFKLK